MTGCSVSGFPAITLDLALSLPHSAIAPTGCQNFLSSAIRSREMGPSMVCTCQPFTAAISWTPYSFPGADDFAEG